MQDRKIRDCTEDYLCIAGLPKVLRLFITLVLPFLAMFLVALSPLYLEPSIKYTLAVFVCVSMLWTFGSIPLAVTGILVPILLTLFGIFTPVEALAPFADPIVFLLIGGLIIAEAFRVNGLDKRMAYRLVTAAGGSINGTFIALMVVSAVFSMWISNTATVALLIPVVLTVAARAGEDGGKLAALLLIGICISTSFGSMATIIGTPTNAVTAGLLARVTPFTFLDWLKIGLVTSVVLLAISFVLLPRLQPVRGKGLDLEPIRKELKELGPLSGRGLTTVAVFLLAIVLWVAGGDLASAVGLPGGFLSAAMVSLLASFLLFIFRALEWEDARKIAWDVFLIVGAGLALGEALEASGTAAWIAQGIASITGGEFLLALMLLAGAITVVVTTLISNTATVAILVPIMLSVSDSLGIDPKYLVLVTGLCASISFITPVGTPPVTLAFATGKFTRAQLARSGLVVAVPATVIIVLLVYLLVGVGWV